MEVLVVFTTQLRAALGVQQESLSLQKGSTVEQALKILASRYPQEFSELVLDDKGNVLPSILACVNDHQVELNSREPLRDGDTLTLLSAISGG